MSLKNRNTCKFFITVSFSQIFLISMNDAEKRKWKKSKSVGGYNDLSVILYSF